MNAKTQFSGEVGYYRSNLRSKGREHSDQSHDYESSEKGILDKPLTLLG